jgi:general secretion pathway protein H
MSVPGSSPRPPAPHGLRATRHSTAARAAGFTLIELLVVVAIVAAAAGLVSLSLRDPQASRLEQEAVRLVTLLETARAESRTAGVSVNWVPVRISDAGGEAALREADFRFVGLPSAIRLPTRWLDPGTSVELMGIPALNLGPEPILVAQQLTLRLGDQRLVVATDGLAPFSVASSGSGP